MILYNLLRGANNVALFNTVRMCLTSRKKSASSKRIRETLKIYGAEVGGGGGLYDIVSGVLTGNPIDKPGWAGQRPGRPVPRQTTPATFASESLVATTSLRYRRQTVALQFPIRPIRHRAITTTTLGPHAASIACTGVIQSEHTYARELAYLSRPYRITCPSRIRGFRRRCDTRLIDDSHYITPLKFRT